MKARFYCENCGKEVPFNAEVCPYCGKEFIAVKCPICGFEGFPGLFQSGCPNCGYLSVNLEMDKVSHKRSDKSRRLPEIKKHRLLFLSRPVFWVILTLLLVLLFFFLYLLNRM